MMEKQPPIVLTKSRIIELALKYREKQEPLTATIERMCERYDALLVDRQAQQPPRNGQDIDVTA